MDFSPFNHVVKLCLQGMELEAKSEPERALETFMKGWQEADNDFERFLAAYYIARLQQNSANRLHWLQLGLKAALKVEDEAVKSAFPSLYLEIARCYQQLNDVQKAEENFKIANDLRLNPRDKGPFYHGTKADLKPGELLLPGGSSNYQSTLKMNHIYFTALPNGASLAAALARGEAKERVYEVIPTGNFENDPNLTDKKFPGNPTRSYRSESPLKIVREIENWVRPAAEDLERFRKKVEDNKGEIIN